MLVEQLGAAEVVVGQNFRFGHRRAGDVDMLRALGEERGFGVTVAPLFEFDGEPVSSSRIRELIRLKYVEDAARILGRSPALEGEVVRGDGRGRELGVPTANLGLSRPLRAAGGGRLRRRRRAGRRPQSFRSAISVGTNPTFDGEREVRVEAHLLHFDEDLYGQHVRVEFRRFLRGQLRFDNLDDLIVQMQRRHRRRRRMTPEPLLAALLDFLRIPSVSSGGGDAAALRTAAEWVAAQIVAAGGTARLVETPRNPLVTGELAASRDGAPTVVLYGHYDVQSAEPLAEWTSPPYEPEVRDGRLYARGATDDKGQILPLLWAARELAAARELPVNVRFLDRRRGGDRRPQRRALAARRRRARPTRRSRSTRACPTRRRRSWSPRRAGTMHLRIEVRSADNDLHSGAGNTVLNAAHVLHRVLAAVLPDEHGRLPEPLRAGRSEPTDVERAGWRRLPGGATDIERLGGRPHDPGAVDDRYRRIGYEPAIDVHGIEAGDAHQVRTQIPATARAMLSMRLAPGQTSAQLWPVLERMLRAAVPAGADVQITLNNACEPARVDPGHPVTRIAVEALQRAAGVAPVMVPAGGSLPVLAGFAARGIPPC